MLMFERFGNHGRFGNQLFQLAMLIGVSIKNNDTYIIPPWEYTYLFEGPFNETRQKYNPTREYNEEHFGFDYHEITTKRNEIVNFYGYFQTEKYFDHCSDEIRRVLKIREQYIPKIESNVCSIHFRGGDTHDRSYGGGGLPSDQMKDWHPIQSKEHYRFAVEYIKSNTQTKKFYCFTDHKLTREWVIENVDVLKEVDHEFVDSPSNVKDFCLMTSCDHNIIANSSYSWWAGWLNNNPNKVVVSPKFQNWFGSALKHQNTKDVIPKSWIQI